MLYSHEILVFEPMQSCMYLCSDQKVDLFANGLQDNFGPNHFHAPVQLISTDQQSQYFIADFVVGLDASLSLFFKFHENY